MAGLNLLTLYDVPVSVPRIHRGTCNNLVIAIHLTSSFYNVFVIADQSSHLIQAAGSGPCSATVAGKANLSVCLCFTVSFVLFSVPFEPRDLCDCSIMHKD